MRKTREFTIEANNRDKGKRFRITEMSAVAQEKWATKAIMAIANSGIELPNGAENLQGIEGLSKLIIQTGIKALLNVKYELAEPLYEELLSCCEYLGNKGENISRPLSQSTAEEVIEEITTLFTIRYQVWKLHTDFFTQEKL